MIGAGVVFIVFGLVAFLIGNALSGSTSDIMAYIELPFYALTALFFGVGLIFIVVDLLL